MMALWNRFREARANHGGRIADDWQVCGTDAYPSEYWLIDRMPREIALLQEIALLSERRRV